MVERNETQSKILNEALKQPNGARFYRCALQVNPFAYHGRHNKQTTFQNETDYNHAIVDACIANAIEAIAITDHYRVGDSRSLICLAQKRGIFVFGGFEAASKEGVHFLCLYDPDKDNSSLERFIGEFGIHNNNQLSPNGNKDCLELLECVRHQGGIAIAAHVAADNGLLTTLNGQARIDAWKSPDLYACALPGTVNAAPADLQPILGNLNHYKRDRPVAIINASDVDDPTALAESRSSCFIKMSALSVEGLRQAFLDPSSRIRLNTDASPQPHAEFIALTWEGGFLDGTCLHFNSNLNVLIGGRGTGKSTIIESIRYVLDIEPLGEEARKAHAGVLKHVLKSGAKVSLLVRSHHPTKHDYTIERTIPNPPVVKNEAGEILALTPCDVVPGVEVFGQHEISELTKSREKLTLLLDRFVEYAPTAAAQKSKLRLELGRSRSRLIEVQREIKQIDERLALLPNLEETLKRFQEAGLEDRLKEKSQLVREEQILRIMRERLVPFSSVQQSLLELLPMDIAFLSPKALDGLPNGNILADGVIILGEVTERIQAFATQFATFLMDTDKKMSDLSARWEVCRSDAEINYEQLLRELHKSNIDGAEFIRLRKQIEELRPQRERREALIREQITHQTTRRNLLDEWENLKASEHRALEKAARKVTKKLQGRVQAKVTMSGNREPLEQLLRSVVGGNLTTLFDRLKNMDTLSLTDLASRCREGAGALSTHYDLSTATAERIAQSGNELFMQIEELELPATTKIELNTAPEENPATWQTLESLSTGQKATAVLLLLLLESKAPLVIDQPEDDLDNRFITDVVVPTMKKEKQKRQFLFSTHNANIPVLGDAELIIGMSTNTLNDVAQGEVSNHHMGSIDIQPVREMVEEILEGGKTAFEMRRQKYGF